MKRQVGHSSRCFAPAVRGLLTVFLMFAYIVVGVAGEISCAKEALASADRIEMGDVPAKADQGSTKPAVVVDHCYTCIPLLVPAPVLVAEPSAQVVALRFVTPPFRVEDHAGLDTPPPKYLT